MKIFGIINNLYNKQQITKTITRKNCNNESIMTESLKRNLKRHTFSGYPSEKEKKEFEELVNYLAKNEIPHRIIIL